MPWLVKDKEHPENNLLFVHVPRCGGTSLVKHFQVEEKSREGLDPYHWFGLLYFFYRYRCLERENFPFRTYENLLSLTQFTIAWIVYFAMPDSGIAACVNISIYCPPAISVSFWTTSIFFFCLNTFVMNAPVMGRVDIIRRFEMWLAGKAFCGFGSTVPYLHGVSYEGYLMHYTADKMLSHKFVSMEELLQADTFAIVRNPYSRMVSIYMYNRYGSLESFDHFVELWYLKWKKYKSHKSTEEHIVYCHVVPEVEFTHRAGDQIVPFIIRQEDLKQLTALGGPSDSLIRARYSLLPEKVLSALKGMPHSNKRVRTKPWYQFYTQRTMDLVLEMYLTDFKTFQYSTSIPKRPELVPFEEYDPSKLKFRASMASLDEENLEEGLQAPVEIERIRGESKAESDVKNKDESKSQEALSTKEQEPAEDRVQAIEMVAKEDSIQKTQAESSIEKD